MDSLLEDAINNEDFNTVKQLVEGGVDVISDPKILRLAAKKGNLEIFKYLVENADSANENQNFFEAIDGAYLEAVSVGNLEIVKWLIDSDFTSIDNEEALQEAITYGQLNIVKYMLENGPLHLEQEDLSEAVESENIDLVKYIMERESFELEPDDLSRARSHDMIKYVVETLNLNYDKNAEEEENNQDNYEDAEEEDDEDVDETIEMRINHLIHDALINAINYGKLRDIKYFIDRGVSKRLINNLLQNIDNRINSTVIISGHYSFFNNNYNIIIYLLQKGANFSLLSENTKQKIRELQEEKIARTTSLLSTKPKLPKAIVDKIVNEFLDPNNRFGNKKHSKRSLKKRSNKRSKKHSKRTLKKRSKKYSKRIYKKHSKMPGECSSHKLDRCGLNPNCTWRKRVGCVNKPKTRSRKIRYEGPVGRYM